MFPRLTSERLRDIEVRLQRDGRVVGVELAQLYDTSEDTIRRDLRALAAAGRCVRVHGGALPVAPDRGPVSARSRLAPEAKLRLGAALAGLVAPGMTVFVDAGSTNLACARQLAVQDVTVVTHAPAIAAVLTECSGVTLITLGGQVDRQVGAALGGGVLDALGGLRFDLMILGACGVDAEAGLTAHHLEDAAVKRAAAARAARLAVAADRAKLGTAAPFAVAPLGDCDILCVEAATPSALLASLRGLGPQIIAVET